MDDVMTTTTRTVHRRFHCEPSKLSPTAIIYPSSRKTTTTTKKEKGEGAVGDQGMMSSSEDAILVEEEDDDKVEDEVVVATMTPEVEGEDGSNVIVDATIEDSPHDDTAGDDNEAVEVKGSSAIDDPQE